MILNNFKKLMISYEEAVFKDVEGNEFKTTDNMKSNRIGMVLAPGNLDPTGHGTFILMGTGKNPVTPNDYSMDLITKGWIKESFTSTFDVAGNTPKITLRKVIKNIGATTITANEIGVFYGIIRHPDYGGAYASPTLIYRKALDYPMIIEPNKTATIVVELSFGGTE